MLCFMYPAFSLCFNNVRSLLLFFHWWCSGASASIRWLDGILGASRGGTGNNWKRWLVAAEHRLELWDIELRLSHHGWRCSWTSREWNRLRRWRQVLVWVEASYGCDVSNVRYLNHSVLLAEIVAHVLIRRKLLVVSIACVINWAVSIGWRIVAVIIILILIIVPCFLEFLWHWWQSHTFRKIRQRVDESSLFVLIIVERAAFSELALSC